MGLDLHGINFLRFAAARQTFGRTATMGRQWLTVPKDQLCRLMGWKAPRDYGGRCEEFLQENFGATTVESFDYSDFEGATHTVDLNRPVEISGRYDTVIDAGTSEHVYNVAQNLKTISQICAPGGQILHILPANNFCGHGFWQFNPGVFFALYRTDSGYSDTQVFLGDFGDFKHWYETRAARSDAGATFMSARPVYAMVRTRKIEELFSHDDVQQLEYRSVWSGADFPSIESRREKAKKIVKRVIEGTPLFVPLRSVYWSIISSTLRLNPHCVRHRVDALIADCVSDRRRAGVQGTY